MRLVVDNFEKLAGSTPIKSTSDKSSLSRTSKQYVGNRDHSGRKPRCFHIETVLGRTIRPDSLESSAANAAGPSTKEITSCLLRMDTSAITFRNMLQEAKRADASENHFSHNVGMIAARKKQEAKAEVGRTIIDRVLWLEQRMKNIEGDDFARSAFAERMGLTYGAYKNSLTRGGFRVVNLTLLAKSLDVSLDFICGLTDECKPLAERQPRPTLWDAQKASR
jgi:hypothetical protein